MVRRTVAAIGALLLLFHGWLFVGQIWNGEMDVRLVAEWSAAAALLWALYSLRRRGHSMFRGRRAVAIWVLAALLHGPAIADRAGTPAVPVPDVVAALVQITVGATLTVGLLLFLALASRPRSTPGPRGGRVLARLGAGAFAADARFRYAPRPPPVA
jgi:hypothetical protein